MLAVAGMTIRTSTMTALGVRRPISSHNGKDYRWHEQKTSEPENGNELHERCWQQYTSRSQPREARSSP